MKFTTSEFGQQAQARLRICAVLRLCFRKPAVASWEPMYGGSMNDVHPSEQTEHDAPRCGSGCDEDTPAHGGQLHGDFSNPLVADSLVAGFCGGLDGNCDEVEIVDSKIATYAVTYVEVVKHGHVALFDDLDHAVDLNAQQAVEFGGQMLIRRRVVDELDQGDENCEGARFAVQLAGKEVGGVIAAALLDDVEIVDDDLERVDGGHDERHQAFLAQGFPAGGHLALGVERVYAKALQLEHSHDEVEVVQGEHVGDDSEGALQGVALGGSGGVQRFWSTAGGVGDCVGAGRDGARHGDAIAAGARQAAVGAAVAEGLLVEAESRNVDHHFVNVTKFDKEREEAWRGWARRKRGE
ncbi:mucin-5AC [Gracilaria domingensis]|nr:mucin-5AC [Gracilaria domingensis]